MNISFSIPGEVVGKARPRFARVGGFVRTYTPARTTRYENIVKLMAARAMAGKTPIDGAVCVSIALHIEPPKSWSKKKRADALAGLILPTSKPDIDNCIKSIFDACNDTVWIDDKQIVDVSVAKRYSAHPCVIVSVREF